jgi:SpoVK/Ycf46/Vps4 family AAA+-type ATPase
VDQLMETKSKSREDRRVIEAATKLKSIQEKISKKIENSLKNGIFLPFYHLSRIFQLTLFEMDILLICLAPEVDAKYERLYAYLQDDVTKKSPSVNLILDLLCVNPKERTDARACFFSQSPIIKYNIIQFNNDDENNHKPLLSRRLKLDDRIVNYLMGFNVMDSKISSLATLLPTRMQWSGLELEENIKERFKQLAVKFVRNERQEQKRIVVYLNGAYGAGKKSTAEAFCAEIQLPIIIVNALDILNIEASPEKSISRLFREALLQPAAIYIEHYDRMMIDNPKESYYQDLFMRAIQEYSFITFLAG